MRSIKAKECKNDLNNIEVHTTMVSDSETVPNVNNGVPEAVKDPKNSSRRTTLPSNLIGSPNEAIIEANGFPTAALIDTGSMITTISSSYWKQHFSSVELQSCDDLLQIRGAGGHSLPYLGYVYLSLKLNDHTTPVDVPLLVVPDTEYKSKVPLLIGTNVLQLWKDQLKQGFGERFIQTCTLPDAFRLALHSMATTARTLKRSHGVIGRVTTMEPCIINPGQSVRVPGNVNMQVPVPVMTALMEAAETSPCLTTQALVDLPPKDISSGSIMRHVVPVELHNPTNKPVRVNSNMLVGELFQCSIEDMDSESLYTTDCDLLIEQYEADLNPLDEQQKSEFKEALKERLNVFSSATRKLGRTTKVHHEINLHDETPFKDKTRPIPPSMYPEVKQHLKEMLSLKVIRPSKSPWASNVVLVRKPDSTLRFCIDYRKLNSQTIKDSYYLPRIDETLDALRGAKWFSSLDLTSSYWQIEVKEEHKERTAFTVGPLGLYECNVMPFGLCNAPASFQRLMQEVMGDLHFHGVMIYLDDLIVYSEDIDSHIKILKEVLRRLEESGLLLKSKKCKFFQQETIVLGHLVTPEGVKCDPAKVEAVKNYPVPTDLKTLQQFLGFGNFYRRFIPNFAKISRPLTRLLGANPKKNRRRKPVNTEKWTWGSEQQLAFDELIDALTSPGVLAYPDFEKQFILRTDASKLGLGAVLCQECDGKEKVICYGSRTLKKSEENYSAHKLEFLALKWAVTDKFHRYLYGSKYPFIVTTDHNPLTYVLTTAKLDATCHRWLAELSAYNFEVYYKPGKKNIDADTLSRLPRISPTEVKEVCKISNLDYTEDYISSMCVTAEPIKVLEADIVIDEEVNWIEEQSKDNMIVEVLPFVERGKPPTKMEKSKLSKPAELLTRQFDHLRLIDGVLYRHRTVEDEETHQLILPKAHWNKAFQLLHAKMGHLGRDKTLSLFQERFYWPGMYNYVVHRIKTCNRCVRANAPHLPHKAPLVNIQTTQPMELVCIDFLKLQKCKGGYEKVLVITDHFTKYAQAFATKNEWASTTAKTLFDNFFVPYGFPNKLLSDQGANFESKLIRKLCDVGGIKKLRTTSYHPQTNGVTERMNKTLISMIRSLDAEEKKDWKSHLPSLTHAYNCTKHEATGFSPYQLMFGRSPKLPADTIMGLPGNVGVQKPQSYEDYVDRLHKQLESAYRITKDRVSDYQKRHKKLYDRKVRGTLPEPGDLVLLKREGWKTNHKIEDPWEEGTYIIVSQPDVNVPVYKVKNDNGKTKVVHRNRLLPIASPDEDIDEVDNDMESSVRITLKNTNPVVEEVPEQLSNVETSVNEPKGEQDDVFLDEPDVVEQSVNGDETVVGDSTDDVTQGVDTNLKDSTDEADTLSGLRRSTRERKKPNRYGNNVMEMQQTVVYDLSWRCQLLMHLMNVYQEHRLEILNVLLFLISTM